jgi:type II secretory pathway pseudopilin PulG
MSNGKHQPTRPRQSGFGFMQVLLVLAGLGILLASTGQVWRTTAQRDKEGQLLFIGQQFRQALASYRDRSPPNTPNAPATLQELLDDKRFPYPVRHLRRLWRDPLTNSTDWAVLKQGERIVGVHSRSVKQPLRTAFEPQDAAFAGTDSYAQWVFDASSLAPAASLVDNPQVSP